MADYRVPPVPEVFIKEEPNSPEQTETFCIVGAVNSEDYNGTSESPKDLSEEGSGSPLPLLVPPEKETGTEDHLSHSLEEESETLVADEDPASSHLSDGEDSFEESYAAFNVEAQLGNLSDSSGQDGGGSGELDDSLDFIESDQEYMPPRKEKKIYKRNSDVERNHECPLCHKRFLTSSAMNGHVAKLHRTTLGDKYVCHLCGAPGSSRSSLKRHLIRTHKVSHVEHPELLTKKCPHCMEGFSALPLLYEHVRETHEELVKHYFECKFCPALIRSKASFFRHVRRAHPGKEDLFTAVDTCSECNEPFTNLHLLQKHKKEKHPKLTRHQCELCDAIFKYPSMLSRHKIVHENPDKYREIMEKRKLPYTCEVCDRKFCSKARLTTHIKNAHTKPPEERVYSCRLCGMTFPTAKMNNKHYRRVHRPERQKIHCGKCNITFATREECDRHRALHPVTCHVCQKQFLRRDSLREHLLIHSAPRHQCPHCDKKFTQRSNLKRHIRVHTGEKPYKCDYCNRGFSDKSACNSHMRVHTGYERSVCDICGVSFSKKQRLNYHMRIHSGLGLLHCPLCSRPCTSSYSFRKHVESHQLFLTKSLRTLGLLPDDPDFVANALQSLTQVTLDEGGHKTRDTRPFISKVDGLVLGIKEEDGPMGDEEAIQAPMGDTLANQEEGVVVKAEPVEEEDEQDLSKSGTDEAIDSSIFSGYESDNLSDESPVKESGSEQNLVRLFQSLIEKEALRTAGLKKRVRKKKKKSLEDELDDDEDSFEGVAAQCLEIVMSDDEPHDDAMFIANGRDSPTNSLDVQAEINSLETLYFSAKQSLDDDSLLSTDRKTSNFHDVNDLIAPVDPLRRIEEFGRESDCSEKELNDSIEIPRELGEPFNLESEQLHSFDSSEPLKIPKLKISRNHNEFVVKLVKDAF